MVSEMSGSAFSGLQISHISNKAPQSRFKALFQLNGKMSVRPDRVPLIESERVRMYVVGCWFLSPAAVLLAVLILIVDPGRAF